MLTNKTQTYCKLKINEFIQSKKPWYLILIMFFDLVIDIAKALAEEREDIDIKELTDFLVNLYMEYLNIKIIPDFIEETVIRAIVEFLINKAIELIRGKGLTIAMIDFYVSKNKA